MRRQFFIQYLANKYYNFCKNRATEMEVLQAYMLGREAGYSRDYLNRIYRTVDIIQRRTANESKSKNGRN